MPDVGQTLSHYRILRKLGHGGMGEVYLAHDTALERDVAIKFLPQDMRSDPVARERFLREARAVATLNHPHICVVHETSEVEGTPFIVMEYLDGASLHARLARGPLPLGEALRLAGEVAEALEAAHAQHIVHRDLKPANVMLTAAGHAKVTDFGLARRWLVADEATTGAATVLETVTQLTQPGTTVGTLAYMSPEQLQNQPVDQRSDIFSFGTMLYEMVTGVHPFKRDEGMATAAAILSEEPTPLAQRLPGVPKRLAELVARMLAKVPARRPQSMRESHEVLKGVLLEVEPPAELAGLANLKRLGRVLRRPQVAIPLGVAVLALVALGIWFGRHQAQVRWARLFLLPQIEQQINENDVWRNLIPPYELAKQAEAIIPGDPKLNALLGQCSLKIDIKTEPPGATVSFKEYATPDAEWTSLGVTPLEQVRVPVGIFRWKLEKEGYETVLAAASTWITGGGSIATSGIPNAYNFSRTLDKRGSVPAGMVRVQATEVPAGRLEDFFIGRFEVTNREYKAFMEAGGYRNREYWKQPFVKDARTLAWDEAMAALVDSSGQPGPSTWLGGDYPEGRADYPVQGVSWYEALAYAEYSKMSLPTTFHWNVARGGMTPMIQTFQLGGFAVLAPFANFGLPGPVPVGSLPGVTAYGAYDMAGNVREWCWNETPYGRVMRGGAWEDNTYEFGNERQAPAMDRSPRNGFRLAFYPRPEAIPAAAFAARSLVPEVNVREQKPVSDEIFAVYKQQFAYDKTPLNARVDSRDKSPGGWTREKVSFDAVYGGERVFAYLFLPANVHPPYQTVVYFPGSATTRTPSSQDLESYYEFPMFVSFLVKNGRAVLFPVYKGMFERGTPVLAQLHPGRETHAYTEFLVQMVKDLSRSIDYLETRADIDGKKIAFYGMSWGGWLGSLIPAVEERFVANVLVAGGLGRPTLPKADTFNYVTRIKVPTLMLNGKYDSAIDTRIKPMIDLLGTPAGHKRLVLYETDHVPPKSEVIKETLAWLDRYLGPVQR